MEITLNKIENMTLEVNNDYFNDVCHLSFICLFFCQQFIKYHELFLAENS